MRIVWSNHIIRSYYTTRSQIIRRKGGIIY
jgi:hypothetical protein